MSNRLEGQGEERRGEEGRGGEGRAKGGDGRGGERGREEGGEGRVGKRGGWVEEKGREMRQYWNGHKHVLKAHRDSKQFTKNSHSENARVV